MINFSETDFSEASKDQTRELFSGETYDYTGEYRIVRFFNSNGFDVNWDWNDVTLVTHASLDKLYLLRNLVKHWQGSISISIFVPDLDASYANSALKRLKACDPLVQKYVSFHLVYPADIPADVSMGDVLDDLTCEEFKEELIDIPSYDKDEIVYPHNLLRNVARSGVYSEFFFLIDIDLMPTSGLRKEFLEFVNEKELWDNHDDADIYIVPAFELEEHQDLPQNKAELVDLVKDGAIRPFHTDTCENCHKAEKYNEWEKLQSNDKLEIGFQADWSEQWEPFYFARRK